MILSGAKLEKHHLKPILLSLLEPGPLSEDDPAWLGAGGTRAGERLDSRLGLHDGALTASSQELVLKAHEPRLNWQHRMFKCSGFECFAFVSGFGLCSEPSVPSEK